MLRKLISGFDRGEVAAYRKIKNGKRVLTNNTTGQECFDLSLIYPVQNKRFVGQLLNIQDTIIRRIIGNTNQYNYPQSANDFHLTFLSFVHEASLSETLRQEYRDKALDLIHNKEKFLTPLKIHFFGGCITQDAIIINGYNFQKLNESRVAAARYGMRVGLFSKESGLKNAFSILEHNVADQNLAHMTLFRFNSTVDAETRAEINRVLQDVDFGEVVLSKLELREIRRYGLLNGSQRIGSLLFTQP